MHQLAEKLLRNIEKTRPLVAYSAPVKNPTNLRVHELMRAIVDKSAAAHGNEEWVHLNIRGAGRERLDFGLI